MLRPDLAPLDDAATAIVRAIGAPCLLAVSVKITPAGLSGHRWLLTLPTGCLAPADLTRTFGIARGFLGHDIAPLLAGVPRPLALHIGCDGRGDTAIRKVYLEEDPARDGLVFLALKAHAGRVETHRYTVVDPAATLPTLGLPDDLHAACDALLASLPPDLPALLVLPDGGTRRSMDLNLSDVPPDPSLRDLIAALADGLHPQAGALVHDLPGQVAVGRGADGQPFAALYSFPCWLHPDGRRTAAQPG